MDFRQKIVNSSPELEAKFIDKLFFWWLKPIFSHDKGKNLEIEDMYHVLPENSSKSLGGKFEDNWIDHVEATNNFNPKPGGQKTTPNLTIILFDHFSSLFWYYGGQVFIICVLLRGLLPYILGLLIWHFDPRSTSTIVQGYIYASLFIIMIILQAMVGHHSVVGRKVVGMKMRVALSSAIYRKILRLSITVSNQYNVGTIINLLSSDVSKFEDYCMFWHYIWVLPIQISVMGVFIRDKVGVASLVGLLCLGLETVYIQRVWAKMILNIRARVAGRTDERVRWMSEIVSGIRVIKMFAWEKPFEKFVSLARRYEVDDMASKLYLRGLSVATSSFAENTSMFFIILTYVLLGNPLEASIVYSVAQYFGMIKTIITVFYPRAMAAKVEVEVAIQRIQIIDFE